VTDHGSDLTLKKIFVFWLPLAGTWLIMSVEGPFLAAIVARMPDPKYNLAAYGVAFAIALIVEAPIIMILSAATSLVRDQQSFRKLRNFTYALNLGITAIMFLILIPAVFDFLTLKLIGLPENVAYLTHGAVVLLIPWPAAIGFRRFYQGIMIRRHATRRVAYATVVRLIGMGTTALVLFHYSSWPGVHVGAASLSAGVLSEVLATRWMVSPFLRRIINETQPAGGGAPLGYRKIIRFYYPLALTSLLTLGVHPIVTFFIGRSPMAIESLAVLPVVNSLVFIFRGLGLSFQEVGIALMGDELEHHIVLRRFATILGICLVLGLSLVAFTPASTFWFETVSGLSHALAQFALTPLKILALFPALAIWISFQRSILVTRGDTVPVTVATALEVVVIVFMLGLTIQGLGWVGVLGAACSYFIGRLGGNVYLIFSTRKHTRRLQ